ARPGPIAAIRSPATARSSSPSTRREKSRAFLITRSMASTSRGAYGQIKHKPGRLSMSDIGAFLAANRRNWDERVPIHRRDRNGFYAVERFLRDEEPLQAIALDELGDVTGKRLIHLQCHFGLDPLALLRHGRLVTE